MRPLTIPALLSILWSSSALAADVDRFEPSGSLASGQGTLQGESPVLPAEGGAGGLYASFAQDPVVRSLPDGRRLPEVAALLPLTLYGGYTIGDAARFEAFLPLYGWVDAPIQGYRGMALGDIRLQAHIPLTRDPGAVGFSLIPRLGLPTGTDQALTRQGFSGSLLAAAGGEAHSLGLGWIVNLGVTGARSSALEGVRLGSTVDGLVGGYWRASSAFRLGAEADLRASLVSEGSTTTSWHLFAQNQLPSGLGLTVGGGGGVGGIGAPEFRAFAALTFAKLVNDRDGDGIIDAEDLCPDEPEDFDGFQDEDGCPDLDNDGDGIGDYMDQCPLEPEDLDGFEDHDGCPDPDNDQDGILDEHDRCPNEPGPAHTGGCPDSDNDGLVDSEDLCPAEPGPAGAQGCPDADGDDVPDYRDACPNDPKPADMEAAYSDGCPQTAWLAGDRIALARPLTFHARNAVSPDSLDLVDAVAQLLTATPQVKKVEVQVHHDDSLDEETSLATTQQRAEALVRLLTQRGVEEGRLEARGHGKTQPIDTNRTPSGRARNRRVELHILQQEAIPRPEWPPPPQASRVVTQPTAPVTAPASLSVRIEGGGWAEVFINGKRIQQTAPFEAFTLSPGVHEIRVTNRSGIDHHETIEVTGGQSVTITAGRSPWGETRPRAAQERPDPWAAPSPWSKTVEKPEVFDGNFPLFPPEEAEEAEPPEEVQPRRKRRNER